MFTVMLVCVGLVLGVVTWITYSDYADRKKYDELITALRGRDHSIWVHKCVECGEVNLPLDLSTCFFCEKDEGKVK